MSWCPNCKNEYVEGITHCPDCDVDLVEELPQETESLDTREGYPITDHSESVPPGYEFPENFNPRDILEPEKKERPQPAKLYVPPEERYKDMHSSAWSFFLIGASGLVFMILGWTGILRLPFHNFVLFVMTALFAAFIGIGIVSWLNAKKLKDIIVTENNFMEDVVTWYHTKGCQSPAFDSLDKTQPEELLYFQKSEIIRTLLTEQFPHIEASMLDKLVDDFCEEDFS